jgi:uncharacterized DUF497 family protein
VDFLDAVRIFDAPNYRFVDDRFDYGEERVVTVGRLRGRMVIVIWTQQDRTRHIISMRKANDREKKRYEKYLD